MIYTLPNDTINFYNRLKGKICIQKMKYAESVRSSLRKRLDRAFDARSDTYATATTDSLVEILIDCSLNKEPLTMGEFQEQSQTIFSHRA